MQRKPTTTEIILITTMAVWTISTYRVLHPTVYLVGIELGETIALLVLGIVLLIWTGVRIHRGQR